MAFGDSKIPLYGTYGEFTIGGGVSAKYIMTKIKPSGHGWESELASMMVPWREIFELEEMSFDELLQRDLDDSRVAHDLIPYLLSDGGKSAKFFPPILAVMVPINDNKSGINSFYPSIETSGQNLNSQGFYEFSPIEIDGQVSPLGQIKYSRQKTSFIIVDGQHRAMAVLALHRQLNKAWKGNRYASYYSHVDVTHDQVSHIELPVCILTFPDVNEDNKSLISEGIDLQSICREVFLVVNKNAKKVSSTRELLLDDDDFAARMMRASLSKLKDRGEFDSSVSRIYCFSYGDEDGSAQVLTGKQEYSSAVFLHKMHSAISFGQPDSLCFSDVTDITDGRRTRNSQRPLDFLINTDTPDLPSIQRFSARTHSPDDAKRIVDHLGPLVDDVIFTLYDSFLPYANYNKSLRDKRDALSQPHMRSDEIQSKCYALMFEGSGARDVFESHRNRLEKAKDEALEAGGEIGDYIENQISFSKSVLDAIDKHQNDVWEKFSCFSFSISYDAIHSISDEERSLILSSGKTLFSTFQTQAFQLGFLMSIHSISHFSLNQDESYSNRLEFINKTTKVVISCLNSYFSESSGVTHRSLKGFIKSPRSHALSPSKPGLRGLLKLSGVSEINEKQWVFFRYAIFEIIFSKTGFETLKNEANITFKKHEKEAFLDALYEIAEGIIQIRGHYIERSMEKALSSNEFSTELLLIEARSKESGNSDEETSQKMDEFKMKKREDIRNFANENLISALEEVATLEDIRKRIEKCK